MANDDDLSQELAYFESIRKSLVKHNFNQFAVIKGEILLGTYSNFDDAFNAGIDEYGAEIFLVKKVLEKDEVQSNPALTIGLMRVDAGS